MRILLLNDDFPPEGRGGGASVVAALARGYRDAGHDVHVLTTHRRPTDDATIDSVRVTRLGLTYALRQRPYRSLRNAEADAALDRFFREQGAFDAAHAHNVHTYLTYGALAHAKRHCRTLLLTFHDVMSIAYGRLATLRYLRSVPPDLDYRFTLLDQIRQAGRTWNPLRGRRIRAALRFADTRVAVSRALRDALTRNGIPVNHVIHNGIRVDEAAVDPSAADALRARWSIRPDEPVVFFGGRLSGDKGITQLFDALESVRPRIPKVRILIVGDQEKATRLLAQQDESLRADAVITGWLDRRELLAAMALSQVVATPSACFDSFPTVNLEAMALGKPVIATWFGGSSELVVDGETGYIVNPFDTAAFGARLAALLTDAAKAERMGAAGRARVTAEFTVQKQVDAYLALMSR